MPKVKKLSVSFWKVGALLVFFAVGLLLARVSQDSLPWAGHQPIDVSSFSDVNPLAPERPESWKRLVKKEQEDIKKCITGEDSLEMLYCFQKKLKTLAKNHGARFALDVIQPVAQENPEIFRYNHEFAHYAGDGAMEYEGYLDGNENTTSYTDLDKFTKQEIELVNVIGKALVDCDGWGAFGCYHGVIEVGLARLRPEDRTRVVKKACLENPLIQKHRAFINQCLHWFGHGMAIFTDQPLMETLSICEGLNPNFNSDDVQLCVSGVFHSGAQPGETDDEYLHNLSRVYSPDDVYYPCYDMPLKYKRQCFSQVPGRTGPDVAQQFKNCDGIPEKDPVRRLNYIHWCYNSAGNNALVLAEFSAERAVKNCRNFSRPEYLKYCYEGAVRYAILRDPLLNNSVPFEICRMAEPHTKELCYTGLGAANWENYFSQAVLQEYCQTVPTKFYQNCMMLDTPDDFGVLL